MFQFKIDEKINYPWICISKSNNKIVLTTKKIGSRFFEDITRQPNSLDFNCIDVRLQRVNLMHTDKFDKNCLINDISITNVGSKHTLTIENFFTNFNVTSFKEFFSEQYFKNNKIYVIVRNPHTRFYTGFFEKVDSMAANEFTTEYLKTEPQHIIDSILNRYANILNHTYLSDEHMSLWNTFMYELLNTHDLLKYVTVIDLADSEKMNSTFGYLEQPTNKPYLDLWLSNPNNILHINEIHSKLGYYFDLEMKYYNKLLNLNK